MGDRAKIKGKADKVLEWAKGWSGFDGFLKLNALVNQENDASLNIVVNDKIVQRYIDGSAIRDFTVQFKMVLPWSDGFDMINIQGMEIMSDLLDWIDNQYPDNLPEWEGCNILEITALSNAPSLDAVNSQDSLAEYSVQAVIRYEE